MEEGLKKLISGKSITVEGEKQPQVLKLNPQLIIKETYEKYN